MPCGPNVCGMVEKVKVLDGATYTIIKRASTPGLRDYRWVGDDGREIELTNEEPEELSGWRAL